MTTPAQVAASRTGALLLAACLAITFIGGCGDDEPGAEGSPESTEWSAGAQTVTNAPSAVSHAPNTVTSNELEGGASQTSGAPSSAPTPTDRVDDQAIVDRYVGFWEARLAANTGTPDPHHPALAEYATGNQLEAVIAETQRNLDEDRAFQSAPDPVAFRRVTVVSVDGDRAEVQECFVDDTQVVERATGAVVNDVVSTQSVLGSLRLVDGRWRVAGSRLVQRWEGVAGCALAS